MPLTMTLTISDVETAANDLILIAESSQTDLVAHEQIAFDGTGMTRTMTITPTTNMFGMTTITVTISDGELSMFDVFSLTVNAVNDRPQFVTRPSENATASLPYEYNIRAEDIDIDDELTITAPMIPDWATLSSNGMEATLSGIPTNINVGSNFIVLQVCDTGGLTDTQIFDIVVAATGTVVMPHAPIFTSEPIITATQDTQYSYHVTAYDEDGDVMTITVPKLPHWLSFDGNGDGTGRLDGVPTSDDVGSHDVILRVIDPTNLSDTQQFTIIVTGKVITEENQMPIATDDEYIMERNHAITVNVLANDNDSDGDELSIVNMGHGIHGQVTHNEDDTLTYRPQADFIGRDSFSYTVGDGHARKLTDTDIGHVTIVVTSGHVIPPLESEVDSTLTFTDTHGDNVLTFTISIPAQTAPYDLTIVYTNMPTQVHDLPSNLMFVGRRFKINTYHGTVLLPNFEFEIPITVTVYYDETFDKINEKSIKLKYWHMLKKIWNDDGIKIIEVDTEENRLIATIAHLTEFALFADHLAIYLPIILK